MWRRRKQRRPLRCLHCGKAPKVGKACKCGRVRLDTMNPVYMSKMLASLEK